MHLVSAALCPSHVLRTCSQGTYRALNGQWHRIDALMCGAWLPGSGCFKIGFCCAGGERSELDRCWAAASHCRWSVANHDAVHSKFLWLTWSNAAARSHGEVVDDRLLGEVVRQVQASCPDSPPEAVEGDSTLSQAHGCPCRTRWQEFQTDDVVGWLARRVVGGKRCSPWRGGSGQRALRSSCVVERW